MSVIIFESNMCPNFVDDSEDKIYPDGCTDVDPRAGSSLILTIFVCKNGVGRWTRLSGNRQIVYNVSS